MGSGGAIDTVLIAKSPWVRLVDLGNGIVGTISVAVAIATIAATAVVTRIVRRSRVPLSEREEVS
jgi:hypothetical protein